MKKAAAIDLSPRKEIAVVLAEDHASFRKSLKLLVETDAEIKVMGEAKNGLEAVRLALSLRPEVVVMDIGMPLLNGFQATRQIMDTVPAIRVIILSAHPEPEYVKQAIVSGASGYLIKQFSTQFLGHAIRVALTGHSYLCPSISRKVRDQCLRLFRKYEALRKGQDF